MTNLVRAMLVLFVFGTLPAAADTGNIGGWREAVRGPNGEWLEFFEETADCASTRC